MKKDISLIILCAGDSTRFLQKSNGLKKQWIWIESKKSKNIPLWLYVLEKFKKFNFKKIVLTASENEIKFMKKFINDENILIIKGGNTRQNSIKNAIKHISTDFVMITDVARTCVPKKVIKRLIKNRFKADSIVPILKVSDTVVLKDKTVNREDIKLIQTPQLSKTKILKEALKTDKDFTDDSSAIKAINGKVEYIKGSNKSKKITFLKDLKDLKCIKPASNITFNGIGFDIHGFEKDKQAILGGIKIESDFGFKAHSDGDVLIHSIIDAILGAINAGDIGEFFPDTDNKYKNIDSKILLKEIVLFCKNVGFEIINLDVIIIAQIPKINPYKDKITKSLSKILKIEQYKINIKATTAEKLGFIGRKEGIGVKSIVTMKYKNYKELL